MDFREWPLPHKYVVIDDVVHMIAGTLTVDDTTYLALRDGAELIMMEFKDLATTCFYELAADAQEFIRKMNIGTEEMA